VYSKSLKASVDGNIVLASKIPKFMLTVPYPSGVCSVSGTSKILLQLTIVNEHITMNNVIKNLFILISSILNCDFLSQRHGGAENAEE
jgi:hypothetical protein